MRTRKPSKALTHLDVSFLFDAWHRARHMGLPLNILITARPDGVDRLAINERCRIFLRIKKNYTEFARRHGFPPTFLWTREISTTGTGEHLHLLCHAPSPLVARLMACAERWLPGPCEMDARRASQAMRRHPRGKLRSAITYIVKQMTSQAAFRRPYSRRPGGTIHGDRCGASHNLRKGRIR
ncbi:MAG: hypothetical protein O9322_01665 [Beijerinckiaceae bacterium]|nr:hypothetical protein [Beijerinckiaceae bacterium]MCZ8301971.1 hypothetical protein [Beijerinckiaceae bacterium]